MNTQITYQQQRIIIVCGDLPVVGITSCLRHFYSYKVSVHKVHYLRCACSQNDHLRNVNSHFSIYASLDSELSESDTEFIDRLYIAYGIQYKSKILLFISYKPVRKILTKIYNHEKDY